MLGLLRAVLQLVLSISKKLPPERIIFEKLSHTNSLIDSLCGYKTIATALFFTNGHKQLIICPLAHDQSFQKIYFCKYVKMCITGHVNVPVFVGQGVPKVSSPSPLIKRPSAGVSVTGGCRDQIGVGPPSHTHTHTLALHVKCKPPTVKTVATKGWGYLHGPTGRPATQMGRS